MNKDTFDRQNDQIDLRTGEQTRRQLFGDQKTEFRLPTCRDDDTGFQNPTYTPTSLMQSYEKNEDEVKGISFYIGSVRSQSICSKEVSQNESIIFEQEEVAYAKFNSLQNDRLNFNNKGIINSLQDEAQNKFLQTNVYNNLNKNFDEVMIENIQINNEEQPNRKSRLSQSCHSNNNHNHIQISPFSHNNLNIFNIGLSNNSVINDSNSLKQDSKTQILNMIISKQHLPIQQQEQTSLLSPSIKYKGFPKRSETCIAENNTNTPLISRQMTQSAQIHLTQKEKYGSQKQKGNVLIELQQKKRNSIRPLKLQTSMNKQERSFQRQLTSKKKPDKLNETWKTRGLFILFFVRKFIVYLKNISQDNKFRQLNENQFDIINDRSNHTDFYKYGNFLVSMHPTFFDKIIFHARQRLNSSVAINSKLYNALNSLIQKADIVINPESAIKLIWDGIMLFLLLINIFYIPLKIGFEESAGLEWPSVLVFFLNDMPGWIFIIDTLLNFNTSFYKKGVIITDRQSIVNHYLKNQFFWDIFVLVPFVISLYFQIKYLDAILLLRFNRILKIFNNYLELMNLKNNQVAVVDLCKLVVLILFIAHFCGCAFYLLSYFEVQSNSPNNWLDTLNKAEGSHKLLPWYSNYISSFYYAVITMITVGYGDIVPQNDVERIFVIIITLISCGVFAYSINSIGSIISILTQNNTQFKQKMSLLSIHMRKRGLSTDLQMKVKKYFEYLNDEKLEDNQEGENMISQLTNTLKHDIAQEIYGKILNSKKLFTLNFSQQFLKELAPKLKEKRHGPEEIIYQQNEICNKLYFLTNGAVNLFLNVRKSREESITQIRSIFKSNGIFGEIPFFSGMKSDHGAITSNVVSLVYISLEDFLEVLKNHPLDHEKYQLIKDNYNLYSSSRGLGCQCQGCGKFTHQINECPMINYISNKDQIIQKHKKSDLFQNRSPIQRKCENRFSTLQQLQELKEAAIQIIVELENITQVEYLFHRIEELDGTSNDEDHDQKDFNNSLSNSSQTEEVNIYKKDESLFPSLQDQQSDLTNVRRSSKLNVNANMNNSTIKLNFDKNSDKQLKLLSFLSRKISYEDCGAAANSNIITSDLSHMNNSNMNNNITNNITNHNSNNNSNYKNSNNNNTNNNNDNLRKSILRSAIRVPTFISRLQHQQNLHKNNNTDATTNINSNNNSNNTTATNNNNNNNSTNNTTNKNNNNNHFNCLVNQDYDQENYFNNNKKTKSKFLSSPNPNNNQTSNLNIIFNNSPQMKQRKSLAIPSPLNLQSIKEVYSNTNNNHTNNWTDYNNNQDISKLYSFSKIIDLDIPREYKIYYPKNNMSQTIKQNNTRLKIKNFNILEKEKHLQENPDKIKEYYKTMIVQKKKSLCQKRQTNSGLGQPSIKFIKSSGNSSSIVQQTQLASRRSFYLKQDSPTNHSPSINEQMSLPFKN